MNSLQLLEKKATAAYVHISHNYHRMSSNIRLTPKIATLLTTLAFSGDVRLE